MFIGKSISPDLEFVAGFEEIPIGHAGDTYNLFLSDVKGAWVVPIEGGKGALDPSFSRVGDWIAFRRDYGGIHIGKLEIEWP